MKSRDAELHFERGIHLFRGGFFPAALREFRLVRQLDPDYPNINHFIEVTGKKTEEVSGHLSSFIEETFDAEIKSLAENLVVEGSGSLASMVEGLLRKGHINEALEKLRAAEAFVPQSKPLLLMMANIQRRIGQMADAEKTLLRARTHFPKDPEILNNLGNVYLARNLFQEAREHFEEAMSLAPDDLKILNNFGALKMETYHLDEARDVFTRILQKDPRAGVSRRNLENLETRIRSLEDEISKNRAEAQEHPTYLDIQLALGKALLFRGFFPEARNVLEGVLQKNPNIVSAHYFLGTLFELKGSLNKAVFHFREMVLRKEKSDRPEYQAFERFHQEGYLEEALIELKKIAVLELDLAASRINLGVRYFEEGLWTEALRHFEEASAINSGYPDAFYWMAQARIQLGKKAAAEKNLREALRINPKYADAHFQLGMLLRKKSPSQARAHFQKALKLGLRSSFAEIARGALELETDEP